MSIGKETSGTMLIVQGTSGTKNIGKEGSWTMLAGNETLGTL